MIIVVYKPRGTSELNNKQNTNTVQWWWMISYTLSRQFNSIQNSLLLHTVQILILQRLLIQTTATKNKTWIEQPLVCSPYNKEINVDIWYRGTIELFNQSVQFSILTHIKKMRYVLYETKGARSSVRAYVPQICLDYLVIIHTNHGVHKMCWKQHAKVNTILVTCPLQNVMPQTLLRDE